MRTKAFTLIELLIVISIIGILSSFAFFGTTSSQKQARDAQRKSDLRQYQTSIENFANKGNSLFPGENAFVIANTELCSDLGLTSCPVDPKKVSQPTYEDYKYQTDGTVGTGAAVATKYVLWAKLENSTNYWVVCSDGKIGTKASVSGAGGVCPI
ncbi:MAG: type II secretion system protein [Patescibacteria group bacterium]